MKKDTKIVEFPHDNKNIIISHKKKKDWILILTAIGTLIALVAILVQIQIDKKSEMQFRPILDLNVEYYHDDENYGDIYLAPDCKYINKISIEISENNNEPVNVTVEPFYNILYYNQSQKTLLKQILPIYNLEGISKQFNPFDVDFFNIKKGTIAEITFNENTYNVIFDMNYVFGESNDIIYDDYLSNIFNDSIIASIDLEIYLTIDYKDIYKNSYKEVYCCETGFKSFSGYLTDYFFQSSDVDVKEEVLKYNLDCTASYCGLKLYNLENIELNANLHQISENDLFYRELHEFYSKVGKTFGSIVYIPNLNNDLNNLIFKGFEGRQLVFILHRKDESWEGKWKVYNNENLWS